MLSAASPCALPENRYFNFLHGRPVLKILLSLKLYHDSMTDYDKVAEVVPAYFIVWQNVTYKRAKFHSHVQERGEPVGGFITTLYVLLNLVDLPDSMTK